MNIFLNEFYANDILLEQRELVQEVLKYPNQQLISVNLTEFLRSFNETYENTNFIISSEDPNRLTQDLLRLDSQKLDFTRNNKIIYLIHDWWKWPFPCDHNNILDLILMNPCIYILVEGTDKDDFVSLYTGKSKKFEDYFNRIGKNSLSPKRFESVFPYTLWYARQSRLFCKAPIKKILLSGRIYPLYPERELLKNLCLSEVVVLKYDEGRNQSNYMNQLNSYLCCFASSVYDFNQSTMLHKYYEILSSGSLLLVPNADERKLNKLGLFNKIHFLTIDCDNIENLKKTIKYILDDENRNLIDKIRLNGQNICKLEFTLEKAAQSFINTMNTIREMSRT